MKKSDVVNEVAKVTQTKKQAAIAIEIFLGVNELPRSKLRGIKSLYKE